MTPSLRVEITVAEIHLADFHSYIEQAVGVFPLGTDGLFYVLLECLGQCRHTEYKVRLDFPDVQRYVSKGFHRRTAHLDCSHSSTSGHHDVESYDMCKTVVKWKDYKCAPCLVYIHQCKRLLHIGCIVTVGKDDPLRVGSGTAGIGYSSIVIVTYGLSHGKELFHGMGLQKLIT